MLPYIDNSRLTVINFFGGPGTGKSSGAAGLFNFMKSTGMSVDYVSEVAKDYTWEKRFHMLTEQDYIFAKQNNRLRRLVGNVQYAIVDSPLVLGLMYMPDDFPAATHFSQFVIAAFNSYSNINILLDRRTVYDPAGRNQTEDEAIEKDQQLQHFLSTNNIPCINSYAGMSSEEVFRLIMS